MVDLRKGVRIVLVGIGLVLPAPGAHAEDIRGVIVRTLIIGDDSRLVGDVTCTVTGAPCIAFGASGISLHLNGFTITGLADPVTGCGGAATMDQGISTNGHSNVEVRGLGLVQRFRGSGIVVQGTVGGKIENVTATTNCGPGILIDATAFAVRVEANVAVRNGNIVRGAGGITVVGSNNSIRWNETGGNGYADPANDHGIGVFGNNNVIEANTAIGNTNGIILYPGATGNLVRGNIAVGNPPIQVSVGQPATTGVDIWDRSGRGATIFDRNLCVTAIDAPCPSLPPSAIPRRSGI